jgi:succinate dehydrogenase hydrophobic anchor subunit
MSAIEAPEREPSTDSYRRGRSARAWRWTAGSGLALVALATMHIVAQHFIVHQKGGLRTYGEVLKYVANPVIFVLESGFLVAVAIHGMLGVRSILNDLDPTPRTQRRIDVGLWALGTATVVYGMALLITLAVRS